MRFLFLLLTLILQLNVSGYNLHNPQENHEIKTLTAENEDFNERSCILFRYYDPEAGNYISQDPIRLHSGEANFYVYVCDPNSWLDVFGLAKHHTTPRRIYNPRTNTRVDGTRSRPTPLVPENVAKDSRVKGTRGNPNMWDIPDSVHSNIHSPTSDISIKNGGDYNTVFARRVSEMGADINADDVVAIRDQMAKDYDIEQYRPKGGCS